MAYLTFKTSRTHLARLDDVFVDHMVYADRWAQLVGDCLKHWRATASGVRIMSPAALNYSHHSAGIRWTSVRTLNLRLSSLYI